MFKDTITVFTSIQLVDSSEILILSLYNNTEFQSVSGITYSSDGEKKAYSASVYIKNDLNNNGTYLKPKEFKSKLSSNFVDGYFTFMAGQVVVLGDVSKDTFLQEDGVTPLSLGEILSKYDDAFTVLSVSSPLCALPHFRLVLE